MIYAHRNKGRFKPKAGIPDGDSVRFMTNDNSLWDRLEGRPPEIGTGPKTAGTVQLRFEGIDAIEKAAQQPLATQAKESMFSLICFDEESNPEPEGYILVRMTDDKSGRPICFVFAGSARGGLNGCEAGTEPRTLSGVPSDRKRGG